MRSAVKLNAIKTHDFSTSAILFLLLGLLIALIPKSGFAEPPARNITAIEQQRIHQVFPNVDRISDLAGTPPVRTLYAHKKVLGYAFQTPDVVTIPAYSGKPVNLLIILDTDAVIRDAFVLEHHEPILLVGIPQQKLFDFAAKYIGMHADQRVVVGHSSQEDTMTVDAITGATVTVMVVNESIMRAAHKVAVAEGLIKASEAVQQAPATVRADVFQKTDWATLTGNGAIRRLLLTHGQVDDAFKGTDAEGIDSADPDHRGDTFIDLYAAYLNAPTIGRNLLGEKQFNRIMSELNPGDHAIAVMANGDFSFKGSGYVRGGIFDRVQIRQHGDIISFRDLDYERLSDVYLDGMPDFHEMAIFIARASYHFDPGTPWDLELLVKRQTGPVAGVFTSFNLNYQTPEAYIDRPAPVAAPEELPMWVAIWQQRMFQIIVLCVALVVLLVILFLQDYFVKFPRFLHLLRRLYLMFTVGFIGWYALGQLSIVNVLTFAHSLMEGFRWELFLSDPMLFILWSFTAATILLWGRGVFCGWLCPFGALQELINEAARKLKIRQFELPFAVHERLWAIKYLILLGLFGISLQSMSQAERFAEVEPFKTSITLLFHREWWFVTYAVVLLVINIFTRKVYCRYICPLGAALAVPTKLRLFDWLKRRKECGNPCQLLSLIHI